MALEVGVYQPLLVACCLDCKTTVSLNVEFASVALLRPRCACHLGSLSVTSIGLIFFSIWCVLGSYAGLFISDCVLVSSGVWPAEVPVASAPGHGLLAVMHLLSFVRSVSVGSHSVVSVSIVCVCLCQLVVLGPSAVTFLKSCSPS